ncbi:type IX secretion system membrane protein PorP/SprF [Mangrovivirga sp. M17]|uniref:Type IX secretion system membrane protein PorP/SprF n=1 Tax=Mangrovivirga halotolerans TaxID=2993936 RepID=A0ABT3RKR3_9BACT|nr:type IX secretion system membrane protein PorP/SprF [Mangrovivirga halotolerans]MCX2742385.1 type IX secretion system membrane protein PorP/SprF [Mangrovivirga halotolerans]
MKRVLIIFIFLNIAGWNIQAQQMPMYSQYMFNGAAINPAYAGSQDAFYASILWREQWVGVEGAPSTQTLSIHSPLKNQKIAIGGLLYQDQIGVTTNRAIIPQLTYRIPSDNGIMSFGLQAGVINYDADYSEISSTDPAFKNVTINSWKPTFGFGIYYYTDKFYLGASIPQMNEIYIDDTNDSSEAVLTTHAFVTGGYVFDINADIKLKPHLLVKYAKGSPLGFDMNVTAIFRDVLWTGVSYRYQESFTGLLKLQVTEGLQFGYSYDFMTNKDWRIYSSGTHELMLSYRFTFDKNTTVTPKYF